MLQHIVRSAYNCAPAGGGTTVTRCERHGNGVGRSDDVIGRTQQAIDIRASRNDLTRERIQPVVTGRRRIFISTGCHIGALPVDIIMLGRHMAAPALPLFSFSELGGIR